MTFLNTCRDLWNVYRICAWDMVARFLLFWKRIDLVDDKAVFITGNKTNKLANLLINLFG